MSKCKGVEEKCYPRNSTTMLVASRVGAKDTSRDG